MLEREEIYQRVWGYTMARGDRSVDVFVRKLRQKLEAVSPEWRYVHTQFGVGYRFAAEPADGRRPRPAADGTRRGTRPPGGHAPEATPAEAARPPRTPARAVRIRRSPAPDRRTLSV